MGELSEIVDSLENRIGKMLQRQEKLMQANAALEEDLAILKHGQFEIEIENWAETCNSLRLANSLLGSDQNKRETKLKINALIREIDQCISQLSE